MIKISNDRLLHSIGVARLMEEISRNIYQWNEEKCHEMFVLGYLHDIGYEYSKIQSEHPVIGGLLLKKSNYKYWKEVYYHGSLCDEYQSLELDLLNTADMQINSFGKKVTVEERLIDIKDRYGYDSKQYLEAAELAKRLKL